MAIVQAAVSARRLIPPKIRKFPVSTGRGFTCSENICAAFYLLTHLEIGNTLIAKDYPTFTISKFEFITSMIKRRFPMLLGGNLKDGYTLKNAEYLSEAYTEIVRAEMPNDDKENYRVLTYKERMENDYPDDINVYCVTMKNFYTDWTEMPLRMWRNFYRICYVPNEDYKFTGSKVVSADLISSSAVHKLTGTFAKSMTGHVFSCPIRTWKSSEYDRCRVIQIGAEIYYEHEVAIISGVPTPKEKTKPLNKHEFIVYSNKCEHCMGSGVWVCTDTFTQYTCHQCGKVLA